MLALAVGAGIMAGPGTARAALMYDQDVTPDVIFGSGNDNGGFTVDRSNNVELGLRAKLRFDETNQPQNVFNSNGDGTYTFNAGLPPSGFGFAANSTSTAVWNFEWSINSDLDGQSNRNLTDLSYLLEIDFDPSAATDFRAFDPINVPDADHAIGDNSTGNGAGTVRTSPNDYLALIGANNVAQNSWNMEFFDDAANGFPFDGRLPGTYTFRLTAFDSQGQTLAQTEIDVNSIPEPATLALLGAGLAGLGAAARRRR